MGKVLVVVLYGATEQSLELPLKVKTIIHMMGFYSETWRTVSDGSPHLAPAGPAQSTPPHTRLKSKGCLGEESG